MKGLVGGALGQKRLRTTNLVCCVESCAGRWQQLVMQYLPSRTDNMCLQRYRRLLQWQMIQDGVRPCLYHTHITLHLEPCVRLTLNYCCSFPVSAYVSGSRSFAVAAPTIWIGTPFPWPFAVVSPLTVFGANSKLSSVTLLSGLLIDPPHPAPQIRRVSR